MIDSMDACAEASHTACPSPHAWQEKFKQEGNVIAITISSKLSGSYNSACAAKDMVLEEQPDKKIAVIDSRSAGSELVLLVKKICELIESGADFETVVEKTELYSGRMSKIVGFVANRLGFWGIGIGSEQGTIEIKQKIRGSKKALDAIIEDMKERGYNCGKVVISHCRNAEFAESVKSAIQSVWDKAEVKIVRARGLCSYYAEKGGLIIGF